MIDITKNPGRLNIYLNADVKKIDDVCKEVRHFLASMNVVKDFDIILLIREALINAIVHGSGSDTKKRVQCELWFEGFELIVKVSDQGPGFDWKSQFQEEVELSSTSGRGLPIMNLYATRVEYNERGNEVILVKNIMALSGVES